MQARSSATVFGDRFRRRRRWCRESRLGLIFCARGAREAAAEMNRASSRKKSFLFRKSKLENRKSKLVANIERSLPLASFCSLFQLSFRSLFFPFFPFLFFFSSDFRLKTEFFAVMRQRIQPPPRTTTSS